MRHSEPVGASVGKRTFTREDRKRYREKVHRCLDVLARMLSRSQFDFDRPLTGMEVELNLVDAQGRPALLNRVVIDTIADPGFVEELGQYNLEINVPPHDLAGDGPRRYEHEMREQLNIANATAGQVGAGMIMIGILPTLEASHMTSEAISDNPRYHLLEEQMLLARGEEIEIDIQGAAEFLELSADSIAPEAACTSVQFHLQVSPEDFASTWNAAQCLAGVQVALGANSPYFLGRELWRETRIAVFTQATDVRSAELKVQGVRPRVWFGERWITGVFDLFEENTTYFAPLLPILDDEDPEAELEAGRTPTLPELRLLNGTVWRWNRPVYDVVAGRPHLRVENRVLPAGPTVVDVMANAAFYYGAVRALASQERTVWAQMSFGAAEDNFVTAATRGLDARLFWPGSGDVPASELVLRRLLPLARQGLDEWGVDGDLSDRLLGVIEGRCTSGMNGANWQVESVRTLEGAGMDRDEALRRMTLEYMARMHANTPVHAWDAL